LEKLEYYCTVTVEVEKLVEDNCSLRKPKVNISIKLEINGRRQLKPEKS
jgi:hypothetical protein